MLEITAEEHNKRMKRNKSHLGDLWDNIKCSNVHTIGISEREVRKRT